MKKLMICLILLFSGLLLFGQDVVPPANWQDLYDNYGVFFASYLGIAGVAMFIGEILIRIIKPDKKWLKILIVFVLAIAISFVGNLINIGYLAESTWYETILWGSLSGVAANGLWSSNLAFLKTLVELLASIIKKKV